MRFPEASTYFLKDDKVTRLRKKTVKSLAPRALPKTIPYLKKIFEDLPKKPYCSNDLTSGLIVRPLQIAKRYKYIQINPPKMIYWLVFDVDRDNGAFAWQNHPGIKPPNLAIINPKNGHAHLWYLLKKPVCRSEAGRINPLRFLSSLQHSITKALGSDLGYCGLITKNPFNSTWKTIEFRSLDEPYSLCELAENIDLESPPKNSEVVEGVGRNCTVFDTVRIWSYQAISGYWKAGDLNLWKKAVKAKCDGINELFPSPLTKREIQLIALSIAHWTWKRITSTAREAWRKDLITKTHTHEIQSCRGLKSAHSRRVKSLEADKEMIKKIIKEREMKIENKVIRTLLGISDERYMRLYAEAWNSLEIDKAHEILG